MKHGDILLRIYLRKMYSLKACRQKRTIVKGVYCLKEKSYCYLSAWLHYLTTTSFQFIFHGTISHYEYIRQHYHPLQKVLSPLSFKGLFTTTEIELRNAFSFLSWRILKIEIVKNPPLVLIHCTFAMYRPRVYSISQRWSQHYRQRDVVNS